MEHIRHELMHQMYLKLNSDFLLKHEVEICIELEPELKLSAKMKSDKDLLKDGLWFKLSDEFDTLEGTYKTSNGSSYIVEADGAILSPDNTMECPFILKEVDIPRKTFMFFNDTKRPVVIHAGVKAHNIKYDGENTINHLEIKEFYLPEDYIPLVKMWDYGDNLSIMLMNGASIR